MKKGWYHHEEYWAAVVCNTCHGFAIWLLARIRFSGPRQWTNLERRYSDHRHAAIGVPYQGTSWVNRPDGGSVDDPGYYFLISITVSKNNSYVTMKAEMAE